MRAFGIFGESFLDGFTLAGFLNRLPPPGGATRIFAEPTRPMRETSLLPAIETISYGALHEMMELLKREEENRRVARAGFGGPAHGASQ